MQTSEIVFIYNIHQHVLATHVTIFREVIQSIKKLKDDTIIKLTEPIQSIK